jgi:hypothetical protein
MIVFFMDMTVGVHSSSTWKGILGYIYSMM